MKNYRWICRKMIGLEPCGHTVVTNGERPEPIRWSDGHVCIFGPEKEPEDKGKIR